MPIVVPERRNLMHTIPLLVRPRPLARPRVGEHGNMYQPKDNQLELINAFSEWPVGPLDYPMIVDSYINFRKPESTEDKYPTGRHYGDEDNLRKAILDAMVATRIITDDSLVVGGENYKAFSDRDCLTVHVWTVVGTFKRP